MNTFLDEPYFEWLYAQINPVRQKNPARTYWKLFRILFTTEFTWFVPNDDNRLADGLDLRREFLEEKGMASEPIDQDWLEIGCSFLELLIGLSRRAAFLTSDDPSSWFWEILENIKLWKCNDLEMQQIPVDRIIDILRVVIERKYSPTGRGGLFPLRKSEKDQAQVELWYQLHAYIIQRK